MCTATHLGYSSGLRAVRPCRMRELTLTRPYVWTKTSTSASLAMLKLPQQQELEQKPFFACVNVLTADLSLSQPGYKLSHQEPRGLEQDPHSLRKSNHEVDLSLPQERSGRRKRAY